MWTVGTVFNAEFKHLPIEKAFKIHIDDVLDFTGGYVMFVATSWRHVRRTSQGFDEFVIETSLAPVMFSFQPPKRPWRCS